ncbi:DUF1883 domain-containing protein [Methylobacterium sp. D54C]
MNFLHYEVDLRPGESVEVTLDTRANVKLLDASNFEAYRSGRQHRFYGGQAMRSPVNIVPPHPGKWHVVVDLGGYAGTVRASVRTVRG